MPQIDNSERTFAFSERLDSWTTRYSFTPTSYANCGDIMLSSADNKKIWRHDVNETRNSFYGSNSEQSWIEVSFNDLPSDVKVFNSVSAETNANVSARFFIKDSALSDSAFIELQGSTNNYASFFVSDEEESFVDIEGFKYLSVPRNSPGPWTNINVYEDSNVIYLGSVDFDLSLITEDWFYEQEGPFEFKVRLSKASNVSVPVGRYNSYDSPIFGRGPEILIPANNSFNAIVWDAFADQDTSIEASNQHYYSNNNNSGGSLLNAFYVVEQDGDVLTVIYERRQEPYFEGTAESFIPIELFFEDFNPSDLVISAPFNSIFNNGEPMFLQTPALVNGEQLRSPYMRTRFYFNTDGEYMELNAVNADYDISPNHHSLTQKS